VSLDACLHPNAGLHSYGLSIKKPKSAASFLIRLSGKHTGYLLPKICQGLALKLDDDPAVKEYNYNINKTAEQTQN